MPVIYAIILSVLLLYRLIVWAIERRPVQRRMEAPSTRIDRTTVAAD